MNLQEEVIRQRKLMQLDEFADDKTISMQSAYDRQLFGPVYHGTSHENHEKIHQNGFNLSADKKHGYPYIPYGNTGYPPPLDHLGYAIYFTTSKAIATHFNGNTTKNLKAFYLDVPRLETINFGSAKNMMNWWIQNGYDVEMAKQGESGRLMATKKMTDNLKSKYDAVWFKGKGIYRLLDGDQIAVYDPSRIYFVDNSKSQPMEIGAKVICVKDIHQNRWDINTPIQIPKGTVGTILRKENIEASIQKYPNHWAKNLNTKFSYQIKWAKGGTTSNVIDSDIQPK